MSRPTEDEDFWNSSDTTGFSFDDEETTTASKLFETTKVSYGAKSHGDSSFSNKSSSVFGEFSVGVSAGKTLETLVSKRSIALILDEPVPRKGSEIDPKVEFANIQKQLNQNSARATVRSIILGRPYSLHHFRSLESKTQLLKEAVDSADGNAMLSVILFLRNTLKKKLFTQLLQFNPRSLPVYLNFLTTRFEIRSAVEILMALGHFRQAALKDFQFLIHSNQNLDKRLHNLKILLRDHFSQPSTEDKEFIDNFLKFAEWQSAANQKGCQVSGTVTECLERICTDHWSEVRGHPLSPLTLTNFLNIHDRLFHWTAITTRARAKCWEDINNIILTKGWLGAKKLKTVISAERIVTELYKQEAPSNILNAYFLLIESLEKRMDLARKLVWHSAVIDTYIAMRDRQGLVQYQASLNPQTDDYLHAEIALRNTANKWKN